MTAPCLRGVLRGVSGDSFGVSHDGAGGWPRSVSIDSLRLGRMPVRPRGDEGGGGASAGGFGVEVRDWSKGILAAWVPGEAGALAALKRFAHGR